MNQYYHHSSNINFWLWLSMQFNKYLLKLKYTLILVLFIVSLVNGYALPNVRSSTSQNNATSNHRDSIKTLQSPNLKHRTAASSNSRKLSVNQGKNNKNLKTKSIQNINSVTSMTSYIQLNSVTITSNSQFNQSSYFTGNGTKSNPYLLQGYDLTPQGSAATAISISNTNAYFVINGNNLAYASSYFINFNNVTNGIVENNTILDAFSPFYISGNSSNIAITNNTITGTPTFGNAIDIESAYGSISIINNTIDNFGSIGILVKSSGSGNIIENNTISNNPVNGIAITGGTYNTTIKNNNLFNNYIYFETDYTSQTIPIYQNTVSNNFVNNKPVDFLQNTNNPTFSFNPAEIVVLNSTNVTVQSLPAISGPFIIANSTNVVISNMTIKDSVNPGMDLYYDSNITVTGNSILNETFNGISLYSTSASVTNNLISGWLHRSPISTNYYSNYYGIVLGASAVSTNISFNTISNVNVGLYINSNNNTINNNFIENATYLSMYLTSLNPAYSITNNRFYNNSLLLSDYYTTIPFTNNTFDDAPIVLYKNLQNQVLTPNGTIPNVYGQLYIENSNFITVENIKSLYDITFSNCTNITVSNSFVMTNGLTFTSAGNLTILNNMLYGGYSYGLHISPSTTNPVENVLVTNNTIIGNAASIGPQYPLANNGIFTTDLNNSVVKNNTVDGFSYAIELAGDLNTIVSNNIISYTVSGKIGYAGIYVKDAQTQFDKIANNTINNFTYGIYLYYTLTLFNEFYNNLITHTNYGVYVYDALTNSSIYNNVIRYSGYGIYLNYGHYLSFINNTIESSSYGGYAYSSSANNTFNGNTFFNNTYYGLYFDSTSSNNTIINNIFLNNTQEGLILYSMDNVVSLNDFVNNNGSTVLNPRIQLFASNPQNIVSGNYYSDSLNYDFDWDGIVDTPYTNLGSSLTDTAPKANPNNLPDTSSPVIIISPANNTVFDSAGFLLDYNISERSITTIYINNVANLTNIPSGTNMSFLGVGTFNITIKATDLAGNIGIIQITVTIKPPLSISIINPTNTTYNSKSVNVSYSIIGSSNYTLKIYINGNQNSTVLLNNTLWPFTEGYNNLTLIVTDQLGHVAISSIFFSIDTTPPTVTISQPTNTTYTTNTIPISYSISDYSAYTTIIYIDGKANTTEIYPNSNIYLSDGYHNITFVAKDIFNHITIKSIYVTVDAKPTITILTITNTTYTVQTLMLNYTYSNAVKVDIYIDNVLNQTIVTNGSLINFADGYHNITIVVTSYFNKISSVTVLFTITTPISTTISQTSTGQSSYSSTSSSIQTSSNTNSSTTSTISPIPLFAIILGFIAIAFYRFAFRKRKR